jgi:hypothetical protein
MKDGWIWFIPMRKTRSENVFMSASKEDAKSKDLTPNASLLKTHLQA